LKLSRAGLVSLLALSFYLNSRTGGSSPCVFFTALENGGFET
jgi:hypothetical protein